MKTISFLLLCSLAGCGAPPSEPLLLVLKLPDAVPKKSPRYQRFLGKVSHLEVVTEPGERDAKSFSFPPGAWESLQLDEAEIPHRIGEGLTVQVRVWDGTRSEPVMVGKAAIPPGAKEVLLKLSLKVPAAVFD